MAQFNLTYGEYNTALYPCQHALMHVMACRAARARIVGSAGRNASACSRERMVRVSHRLAAAERSTRTCSCSRVRVWHRYFLDNLYTCADMSDMIWHCERTELGLNVIFQMFDAVITAHACSRLSAGVWCKVTSGSVITGLTAVISCLVDNPVSYSI